VTQFLPTREAKNTGLFRLELVTFHPCPRLALLPDAARRRRLPRRPRAPPRAASISLHRSAGLELSSSSAPLPAPPGLEGVGPVGDRGRGGAEEEEVRDDGVEAGRKEAAEVRGPLPRRRGAEAVEEEHGPPRGARGRPEVDHGAGAGRRREVDGEGAEARGEEPAPEEAVARGCEAEELRPREREREGREGVGDRIRRRGVWPFG